MSTYKKIGIIAALEVETDLLKAAMQDIEIRAMGGSEYCSGRIGEQEVVVVQCGMGKVSAAISAQIMIDMYHPDCIINTGCAGAVAEGLSIGDMVIGTETAEWDLDLIAIGYPRGYISALGRVRMTGDAELGKMLVKCMPEDVCVKEGLVVSSDQFVSKPEQRDIILSAFPDALCAEMEGAAVGHVCAQNAVPFCIVRCMSDTADGDSGVNYAEFVKVASEKSAAILLAFL